ncbi:MAG: hypothetical protein NTW49_00540 [Bacteroidia bacterium]|nr:hypothetical protein [Bacteroidia bacterium]
MKHVLIFVLLLLLTKLAAGQCCSAGNPVGGDGSNEGAAKNELIIFTSYKHSLSEDYFHNGTKTEVPYIQKSYYDYNNISLTYGLFPMFSLHTELGYFIDKTQELNIDNENELIRSHGLGDLSFNIRYSAVKTVKPISQVVFSAGVRLPVGVFDEEKNGITIPMSLQPSSGALKYNASAFYFRKQPGHLFGFTGFAFFEMSKTIRKGYLIYRYGNYFQFSVAGTYALAKNVSFIANAKLELRGKDRRESEIVVESSGSRVVIFNPQLIIDLKRMWGLVLMGDIPVYKFVNGYQLTNKISFQFGIRKNISFCNSIH